MKLFKGDVSGGEAGTGFPKMVLLFLSGTMITSNGIFSIVIFVEKKKMKKSIANFAILVLKTKKVLFLWRIQHGAL